MFRSPPSLLFLLADARPDDVAVFERSGEAWESRTWSQVADSVLRCAAGLIRRGVEPADRVVSWADNCAQWVIADLAINACGAVTVPIYATSTPEQARHILDDSAAKVAFFGSTQLAAAAHSWRGAALGVGITLRDSALPTLDFEFPVVPFEVLAFGGGPEAEAAVARRVAELSPDHLATIIYTSSTCGLPKGVMLDFGSLARACDALLEVFPAGPKDRLLSYLPLAHAIERLLSVYLWIRVGAQVYFCDSIERMPRDLQSVRPTVFVGVPRVYEKFVQGIAGKVREAPAARRALFAAALWIGRRSAKGREHSRRQGPILALLSNLASRRVYAPLKKVLGLDRARYLLSGGAPLRRDVMDFLHALDLRVLEVYGQTETLVTTVNSPEVFRRGSVGQSVPGVEVRLASDGEILTRARHFMRGYWNLPDETAAAFDEEGWLNTGDIGRIDAAGFLHITGRKKAILITAGGKNVAPEPLEAELASIRGVAEVLLIGEGRPYLVALLTLDEAEARMLSVATPGAGVKELMDSRELRQSIERGIDDFNSRRARYEQIKRYALLPREFDVETGELTPTLKLRRGTIEERHSETVESLYPTISKQSSET